MLMGCLIAPLAIASRFQQKSNVLIRRQDLFSNSSSIANVPGSSSSSVEAASTTYSPVSISTSSIAQPPASSSASEASTSVETPAAPSTSASSSFSEPTRILDAPYASNSPYVFNPNSTDNVVIYYGKIDAKYEASTNLTTQCDNADIDIVLLAFATNILGAGGYPELSFGGLCNATTSAQKAAGATGLYDCSGLGAQIFHCHDVGKKVFISIGGQNGNNTFASSSDATNAANVAWDIFGGGSADSDLRPFGDVVVDGFDLDNESGSWSYYTDFITALQELINDQTGREYYLSASTTCSSYAGNNPAPLSLLNMFYYIWPQFYSAPSCNLGTANFLPSFSSWSARLDGPRLYIGAPAWAGGTTGGGYENASDFATTVEQAKKNVSANHNFGGVTLWDGVYGEMNLDSEGNDYINVTKTALEK